MKILVVGMGLIGGSLCKAFKKYTNHEVYGSNRSENKLVLAINDGAIDGKGAVGVEDYDVIWLCMYKEALERIVIESAPRLKKGTIIADVCGLKGEMTERLSKYCSEYGINYIGTHPMAGKEKNGYIYSEAELFKDCNFILSPTEYTNSAALETIKNLALEIGSGNIVYANPREHDRLIAYTSHIPHIIAGCYADNNLIERANDFGGGSFRDVSRVATMDPEMWAELFIENKESVLEQIEHIKNNLEEYEAAIKSSDRKTLEKIIEKAKTSKEKQLAGKNK